MAKPLTDMDAAELVTELSYATTACWNVRFGCTEEKKGRILDRIDRVAAEVKRRLEEAEKASHRRGTEDAEKTPPQSLRARLAGEISVNGEPLKAPAQAAPTYEDDGA